MNKILKRLLSVVLAVVMVIGLVPLSGVTTVAAAGETKTIYLDTTAYNQNGGHGWAAAYIHLYNNSGDTLDAQMNQVSTGVYSYEVDTTKYTHVIFKPNSDNNWSGQTSGQTIPTGSENMFYCTNFDKETTGTWRIYNGGSGESDASTFYVQADLIDYYNDNRVNTDDSSNHRYDNQGDCTGSNNAPYSKLNTWISGLDGYAIPPIETNGDGTRTIYWDNGSRTGDVYIYYWSGSESGKFIKMEQVETNSPIYQVKIPADSTTCLFSSIDNFENNSNKLTGDLELTRFNLYTYGGSWSYYGNTSVSAIPLYFGDLFHRKQLTGNPNGTVNEFYRGANVSFTGNTHAVAQGIVGDHLVNGKLVTSYSDDVLVPFFEENAYEGQSQYMKFYKNLQFPFTMETNGNVTKYSFDSKSQTVYYDYNTHSIESSNATIEDASNSHSRGYFPFNQTNPTDKSDLNYGFGTKFTIPFTINPDGKDANGNDVTFNFTGDDDVWVFIDDALVLDMGGAHELASGTINFASQTAEVTASADATIDYNVYGGNSTYVSNSKEKVDFSKITVKLSNGTTAKLSEYMKRENTVHTLTMYYMERGMFNSNMSIDFSFIPLPSGMTLSKQINTANVNTGLKTAVERIDTFDFEIKTRNLKESGSALKPVENLGYTITNRSNNSSMSGQVANNGVVTGLNSSIYAHNFINTKTQGKAFYAGTEFEIAETIPENSILEYESTAWRVYDGTNTSTPEADGNDNIAKFSMGSAQSTEFEVYTKYVNFINTPKVRPVTLTKSWETGAAEDGDEFEFEVLVDLDGEGSAYDYAPYALAYSYTKSSKEDGITGADGKLTLSSGETVEFPGIPVGAKVKVTETQEEDAYWEAVDGVYSKEITVSESEENSLEIINTTKAVTLDKVIYVEAGKDGGTDYTIKDGEDTIEVKEAKAVDGTPSGEITVTPTANGTLNVNPTPANKTYEVEYTGKNKDSGVGVNGIITVHTYALTDDVYVFDYGLKSDLADTTHGNGMFQNDNLYINNVETTAKLTNFNTEELTQSSITLENSSLPLDLERYENSAGAQLKDGKKVIFEPTAFMNKQETATYGTTVYAPGKSTVQSPEDGVVLSDADVKVMPADVVYYEDNFSGIELTANASKGTNNTAGNHENDLQSNENDTLHGNDNAYADDAQDSDGGSLVLSTDAYYDESGNYIRPTKGSDTVKFTFKGTGFDIVGRSSTKSGILTVLYSWQEENGQTKSKILVVDTYFANGNLYQIPVVSVKDLEYREYTVQISLAASSRGNTFYLDGVRVYNPARDDKSVTDNYQEEEQNVTFQNVHDILVGDGDVTDTIITVPDPGDPGTVYSYVVDIEAEGRKAAMVKVPSDVNVTDDVTIDSTPELFGQSNVENIGEAEDSQGTIYTYTETLNDYLAKGPNNEVYLGTQDAIAFYVESTDVNAPQTLQVEAKKVAIGGYGATDPEDPEDFADFSVPVLRTVTKTGDDFSTKTIATIETSTAMYYEIPVNKENCIEIADNKYLVIIAGSTTEEECISISNIKSNGYTISLPEIDNENITLNAGAQDAIEGTHACKVKVGKITVTNPKVRQSATITMTVSGYDPDKIGDIGFDIYFDSANVDEISTMDKGKVTNLQSKVNEDGTITYTFRLKMPTKAQTMKLVVIPKYTDTNVQSVYSAEKTISVKR